MIRFVDLPAQYRTIQADVDAAIHEVIATAGFVGGEAVTSFEREFSAFTQSPQCVGVANGTDAIEIILEGLALPPGSEVIVPANSFVGSSEPVTRGGHRVVFADVTPDSYTLDVTDVSRRLTPRTAAIIAVHLYGHPAPMDELLQLAGPHGIRVIEDCAQAHGATYKGRSAGSIGHAGAFSFYPSKNLGAYGDAGAITTADSVLATRCRMIANHGRMEKYLHAFEGRNSRLDGLQAAILRVKLRHLAQWVETRNRLAALYMKELSGIGDLAVPSVADGCRHAFHLFVVRTKQRDALAAFLKSREIQTGVHYPIALPKLPAYAHLRQGDEPMFANNAAGDLLSLPIGEHLGEAEVGEVVEAIKAFFTSLD
jgi:dTDP-4-amino-4,6-dideoxygalactose transaminase